MPGKAEILIIDSIHPVFMEKMEEKGYKCDYLPDISSEQVYDRIADYTGIVVRSKMLIDKKLLERAARLKFIARAGAGMDNVDEVFARSRNIICLNAPEGNRDAVAEHVLGLILTLFRKIHLASAEIRRGIWDREANRGTELGNKTIGLIGYGNTGKAVAKKLSGFNVNVLAYDKYLENYSDDYAKEAGMNDIFKECDILSLHIPLTDETRKLVNFKYLLKFNKPFYLVNTSRGKIVDTAGVTEALEKGILMGAALDVLEHEDLASFGSAESEWFKKLQMRDNVLLTPHIAGWTFESYYKIAFILADKILCL